MEKGKERANRSTNNGDMSDKEKLSFKKSDGEIMINCKYDIKVTVKISELLRFLFRACFRNHHIKFEVDMTILKCTNEQKDLSVI